MIVGGRLVEGRAWAQAHSEVACAFRWLGEPAAGCGRMHAGSVRHPLDTLLAARGAARHHHAAVPAVDHGNQGGRRFHFQFLHAAD